MKHQRMNLKIELYKVGLISLCEGTNIFSFGCRSFILLYMLHLGYACLNVNVPACTLDSKTSVMFSN